MGCGKSTLGKSLANSLNMDFIDTDSWIENEQGMPIRQIFDHFGEPYFRELEQALIKQLPTENCVIAVGGGFPCFHDNIKELNLLGTTIFLNLTTNTLIDRLLRDKENRPLVKEKQLDELSSYVEEVYCNRMEYYLQSQVILEEQNCNLESLLKLQKTC